MNPTSNPTAPEKTETELELEAEQAEAAVMHGAEHLRSAIAMLTNAVPESAPMQAINSIGKISAGVESVVDQAEAVLTGTIRTAAPMIRLSKKAIARVRANPVAAICVSLAGLVGLMLVIQNARLNRQLKHQLTASKRRRS